MNKNRFYIFLVALLVYFCSVSLVNAQIDISPSSGGGALRQNLQDQMNLAGQQSGLSQQDPRETAARVINVSLGILGTLFLVYVVYAGFQWMTAGGEEEKIKEAQGRIKNGVIGLVIILVAWSISTFVIVRLIRTTTGNNYYMPPSEYTQPYRN